MNPAGENNNLPALERYGINGQVAVITGGAGLLGSHHARAIASGGGIPVLVDIDLAAAERVAGEIRDSFPVAAHAYQVDITDPAAVEAFAEQLIQELGRIDVLINNAANNPKMEAADSKDFTRLENFSIEQWDRDIAVGLTGAFLCGRVIGEIMAQAGQGVILNVASDLSVIAPDQRLYSESGHSPGQQTVKPVTYSVIKTGLIGLTRYFSTYWADQGVRANAISPGGVYAGQPEEFVTRLSSLIPLGRMAREDEYEAAVLFLCSDASSYMTGQNMVMDGGRSVW